MFDSIDISGSQDIIIRRTCTCNSVNWEASVKYIHVHVRDDTFSVLGLMWLDLTTNLRPVMY